MQNLYKLLLTLIISLSVFSLSSHDLKGAISSADRTPANKLRDSERNPYETLSFFGIESDMVVVELSPGGGWYTDCLLYTSDAARYSLCRSRWSPYH